MTTDPVGGAQPGGVFSLPGSDAGTRPAEVEFRDLRYFAAVAEELHFGRAAARLYITQPGLSQAIARMERVLEVQLLRRTRNTVELTEAGVELLNRGRRLLADLDGTVARVRMAGRGEAGLVRIGVAHLAEPLAAPALVAFQADHPSVVVDRSAMVSDRLLEQLAEGRLHAAVIHRVPTLPSTDEIMSEALRRGRLAVLVGQPSRLASRPIVTLSELSKETFLVNPRSLTPGAYEGLKLMCSEFGGFEANVMESAVASTIALDTDWRPIRDGTAVAIMAEATARAIRADGVVVVPLKPPPQYLLALAWRHDEQSAAARRFLDYLRSYRDRHAWVSDPDVAPLAHDHGQGLAASTSWKTSCLALRETTSSGDHHRRRTRSAHP
jgi:DNA-binding transcriptional LysR family regulator